MPPHKTTLVKDPQTPTEPLFTLERANRSLVLVRKIVAAIVARYHELAELRSQRDLLRQTSTTPDALEQLGDQIAHTVRALDTLHRELLEIGCVLKDWRVGLVDFPAVREGQRIWLCWRLGEESVSHWHGLHEGFAARQRIDVSAN